MSVALHFVRGSTAFRAACLGAALASSLAAAQASPQRPVEPSSVASFGSGSPVVVSAALKQASKLLNEPESASQPPSPEQLRVLKESKVAPPVKTIIYESGKKQVHLTLHPFDMLRLARQASAQVLKSHKESVPATLIAAVVLTETSGVSRVGWSSNGKTPSRGLAQLEDATARGLGIADPDDPQQAMIAVARLLVDGMRFAKQHPQVDQKIALSLFYNTSTKLRSELASKGAQLSLDDLPAPTRAHIKNMSYSANLLSKFDRLYTQHVKQSPLSNTKEPAIMTAQPSLSALTLPYQMDASRRALNQSRAPSETVSMSSTGMAQIRSRLAAIAGDKPGVSAVDKLVLQLRSFVSPSTLTPSPSTPTLADQVSQIKIQVGRAAAEMREASDNFVERNIQRQAEQAPRG